MATKIQPLTAWSFSRYSSYKKCPAAFKYSALMKIQEPKNAAMQRGADIHTLAEKYLKSELPRLPAELKLFEKEFKKIKALHKKKVSGAIIEDNWAFTADWNPTQWDNWTECWVRVKLDAAHFEADDVLVVTDWKTGKLRREMHEEYLEQLELYALSAFLLYPHLKEVRPRLVYLDQGMVYPPENEPLVYTAEDVPKLKTIWQKRVAPMFKDKIFAPKANDMCRFCFFGQSGKAKGGPGLCKY